MTTHRTTRLLRLHEVASALDLPNFLLVGAAQETWGMPNLTSSSKVPLRSVRAILDHPAIASALERKVHG
jgi:hypothetical protein